ncbi:uncharacterized protein LOC121736762 [Aricia agestis]|uniref:uncharacterized protein LOC121736762 n=1 Tax=Aricia agestis TaxID=91739 RepID=UPI001C204A26|nr:uncharacterized protein LOC121736762 [Aricia agestis]
MSLSKDLPEVVSAPTHEDFCSYLPWACLQFGVPAVVAINKTIEGSLSKPHPESGKIIKGRKISSSFHLPLVDEKQSTADPKNPKIYITAVFNNANKLIKLIFENKNETIPREVMKVINLFIHKQIDLRRLGIKSGVDKFIIHEISEILKVSHLTEICLDNSFVKEGNYAVLLDTDSLRYLSLSKCKINDKVIEEMCKNLEYPKPASKSLVALVLSTNMITDDGAKFLGEALRSNRKLAYLNLADNRITDEGASYILDTLVEFRLRTEELVASKGRKFAYLKERNTVSLEKVNQKENKKSTKSKLSTSSVSSKKGKLKDTLKSRENSKASVILVADETEHEARTIDEDFHDPFHCPNIYMKEGTAYCKGNNSLLYLNVAYNNLTYVSLKKILEVILYQKTSDIGRGLVDVKLDGNYLPEWEEMQELDELLCQKRSSEESIKASSRRRSKTSKHRRDTE